VAPVKVSRERYSLVSRGFRSDYSTLAKAMDAARARGAVEFYPPDPTRRDLGWHGGIGVVCWDGAGYEAHRVGTIWHDMPAGEQCGGP